MSDGEPRIQVETCLAELQRELAGLGVTATATRDREGRAHLKADDRWGRSLRIFVYVQFFCVRSGDLRQRHRVAV